MSEPATQPVATPSGEPGSDPATTGAGDPAATPAGFVPLGEAEQLREEARRARQSAEDLRQEIARLKVEPKDAPGKSEASGFDPNAFRSALLNDFAIQRSVDQVKSEYPNADPSLFDPDRASQFSSVEAYRQAVKDSDARVAAILDAGWADREQKLRDEFAAKYGDAGAGAGGGGTPPANGDPSVNDILRMSDSELDALEAKNPGVLERVRRSAGL